MSAKLTPEQAERIRKRVDERQQQFDEMEILEKQLGVRDPELEQIDAEVRSRIERLGFDPDTGRRRESQGTE
jgi:hypothetical protein